MPLPRGTLPCPLHVAVRGHICGPGNEQGVPGNDTYGVTVTVTSVKGANVNFHIAVDDQPKQPQ